jgi:NTE family protein
MNAEWPFLEMLFEEGRRCASAFGQSHLADMGLRSTFDIDAMLDEG